MPTRSTLALIAAFALGCAAARTFVVPPAHAQGVQRWEYLCFDEDGAGDVQAKANQAGAEGWEMASATADAVDNTWCFKRAK